MFKDILVIIMAALALIVGVSAWLHENRTSKEEEDSVSDTPGSLNTK